MDANTHSMEHQNAPITDEWMDSQEFPDDPVTSTGKPWHQQEQGHEGAKITPESKSKPDEEKSLDEIQEELNQIILEAIESMDDSRKDFYARLAEQGVDW